MDYKLEALHKSYQSRIVAWIVSFIAGFTIAAINEETDLSEGVISVHMEENMVDVKFSFEKTDEENK